MFPVKCERKMSLFISSSVHDATTLITSNLFHTAYHIAYPRQYKLLITRILCNYSLFLVIISFTILSPIIQKVN